VRNSRQASNDTPEKAFDRPSAGEIVGRLDGMKQALNTLLRAGSGVVNLASTSDGTDFAYIAQKFANFQILKETS